MSSVISNTNIWILSGPRSMFIWKLRTAWKLIIEGDGTEIKEIFENLVKNKGLKYVKLNTIVQKEI